MSRMTLMSLFSLALLACSSDSEPEVAVSDGTRAMPGPTPAWSAPPGPVEVTRAPTPETGPVASGVEVPVLPIIPPGSVEDLVDGEGDPLLEIEVRPGESLVLLSDWSGLSVEALAEANGIRTGDVLYPGQLLEVDLDVETFAAMQDTRDRFEDARLDRYLERRGTLVGVTAHTVGTGETAWQIAKDHGELPMWVIASFNRNLDLDRLRIGQELNLPMLGDTVAMDDEPLEEEAAGLAEVEMGPETPSNAAEEVISTNP